MIQNLVTIEGKITDMYIISHLAKRYGMKYTKYMHEFSENKT